MGGIAVKKGDVSLRLKNLLAAVLYIAGAHVFDGLYAITSKAFSYFSAMGIMFLLLAGTSAVLVKMHTGIKNTVGWDVMGLERLNRLRGQDDTQGHRLWKRFLRWLMKRRLTIFLFGSCFIGPPVVTMLLRKPGCMADTVFYILSGTLISVVTWVTVWIGFWTVWGSYIQPIIHWAI